MGETLDRVPAHLRRYVVQQDYDAYTEVDHAVWRFVLLQTYDRLKHTAHPAYERGLSQTGMSVARIPRVAEMDRRLGEFGWGAVCVDGFIPPRAFVEFQALGILPIAAEIRTVDHLAYTPAPDIIHEAAGHAPILPDPRYARFLRRIGDVGTRAFTLPHDQRIYTAIYNLSEIKEDPTASEARVRAAQQALDEALDSAGPASEAGRLARLYWWTVEYGLVGTPEDYRLYGAGLLSSLGESHFCHDPRVRKIPLDVSCAEVDYDITKPQPQLFVARDFAHLDEVLDDMSRTLAYRLGGRRALDIARASTEVATVTLDTGMQVIGVVDDVELEDGEPALVRFSGPVALASDDRMLPGTPVDSYALPLGPLADGTLLSDSSEQALAAHARGDGMLELHFRSGVRVSGRLERTRRNAGGRLGALELREARLSRGDEPRWMPPGGRYVMLTGHRVPSVSAGAADPRFWPASEFADKTVPAARRLDARQRSLLALYEQALEAWRQRADGRMVQRFERVHEQILREHPDEWLLRWNLLESLTKERHTCSLVDRLRAELSELEERHAGEQPIAMGLRYLEERGTDHPE